MNTELSRFLQGKKLFLLDMDGTLYLGERVFSDTLPFLRKLRERGSLLFLTNNSSRGRQDYVNKLHGLGIPCTEEDFFTSTDAACAHLKANGPYRLIYALGTRSFREQLSKEGFNITDQMREGIDCLLMGYDTELTYQKLVDAVYLINQGLPYLATNPDWVCPTATGYVPDCGAMAQMLEHATGRLPRFLGKPQPEIAWLAMDKMGATREETLIIGDRAYTDIACARAAGVGSILVFSGETTPEILEKSEVQPDFALPGIGEILRAL